jgi:hypothetical protein
MEQEFVSYEQAVALKELLYGEHYGDDYIAWYSSNKDFHYRNMKSPVYPNHQSYIAPLKSQVFRWFREKYKLNVYITDRLHFVLDKEEWKCVIDDIFYPLLIFNTYEEAENACIDKLIELAKQQDNGHT